MFQALPIASVGASSHRTLLGTFHQLVELEGMTQPISIPYNTINIHHNTFDVPFNIPY